MSHDIRLTVRKEGRVEDSQRVQEPLLGQQKLEWQDSTHTKRLTTYRTRWKLYTDRRYKIQPSSGNNTNIAADRVNFFPTRIAACIAEGGPSRASLAFLFMFLPHHRSLCISSLQPGRVGSQETQMVISKHLKNHESP